MQYATLDVRPTERDGKRVVAIDGYHRVHPESKPAEYRRIALLDLNESQVRAVHDRLGEILAEWA